MKPKPPGRGFGAALLIGFVQVVALSALGLLARAVLGAPYPPQALFNAVSQLLGTPAMFQFVHATFGYGQGGKIAAFVAVVIAWIGGLVVLRLAGPLFGTAFVFLGTALLVPMPTPVAYALGFFGLHVRLDALLRPLEARGGRRGTLRVLAGGSVALLAGGSVPLLRDLGGSGDPSGDTAWTRSGELPLGVSAQKNLYYVSKNIEAFDPNIDPEGFRLELRGLVKTPRAFTLSELRAFEAVHSERTLHCISNPVGGPLIGNLNWTGLRLADVLRTVGVRGGAKWVVWHAADGYVESLPLARALEQDVLLVYEANNEVLERRHGFPLRVLIPDRLGMKQPKWLTAIELSTTEIAGYWAERGWTRTGLLETMSRIEEPTPHAALTAGQPSLVRGVAFAGTTPITRVEVSTDGGQTWRPAELTPRRSPYTWTLWSLSWTPGFGPQRLTVRAYADGQLQTATGREALPEAATGWHSVDIVAS